METQKKIKIVNDCNQNEHRKANINEKYIKNIGKGIKMIDMYKNIFYDNKPELKRIVIQILHKHRYIFEKYGHEKLSKIKHIFRSSNIRKKLNSDIFCKNLINKKRKLSQNTSFPLNLVVYVITFDSFCPKQNVSLGDNLLFSMVITYQRQCPNYFLHESILSRRSRQGRKFVSSS